MADLTKITKQVLDLLNANSYDSGGVKEYSATSGDEDFLDGAVARAIEEAKIIAAERICLSDNSTLKTPFIQSDEDIEHGDLIPIHYGNVFNVKITPYSGATNVIRGQKRTSAQIGDYRSNPDNMYGQIAHDEEDTTFENPTPSQLAGFYSDEHNLFEFTGESATISYADFTNVALSSYPVSLEVPITHIAVGLLAKDGSVSNKFGEHMQIGLGLLGDVIADKKEAAE
jgi:hypothetical protein